jgi:hypothetical protein
MMARNILRTGKQIRPKIAVKGGMVQKKPISGNSTDPPRPGRNRPVDRVVDTLIPGERRVAQQLQPMPM